MQPTTSGTTNAGAHTTFLNNAAAAGGASAEQTGSGTVRIWEPHTDDEDDDSNTWVDADKGITWVRRGAAGALGSAGKTGAVSTPPTHRGQGDPRGR